METGTAALVKMSVYHFGHTEKIIFLLRQYILLKRKKSTMKCKIVFA